MSRTLAIDYGLRRVGIAVTDSLKIIASPLTTVAPDELVTFLSDYMKKETVDQMVVGYPLKEDGSPTDLTSSVDELIVTLRKSFPKIALYKQDERYTSRLAKRSMLESGSNKKSRRTKEHIDQISATLILQSFMEGKNKKIMQ